jgi:N-methylhydantoinase A/oxoprolinase/acetone carboxylase beta subunit
VVLDGEARQVKVVRGSLPAGEVREGPVIVELPESTLLVAPGWQGEADHDGTIRLERPA